MRMSFNRGDLVEICSKEEGFRGSYYAATVISNLGFNTYTVQYENLLEDDESRPLIEVVPVDEVRPTPPSSTRVVSSYSVFDTVDAFDNDGWWVGRITGRQGENYFVYFECSGDEIAYPVSRLRVHQEWINGNWVPLSSKKRVFSKKNPASKRRRFRF